MIKRLCDREPDLEMFGFQYFDKPIKVLSLSDGVSDFYTARKRGDVDTIDYAFARLVAIRHKVFNEPIELIVDVYLYRLDYQTSWSRNNLIDFVQKLSDQELSIATNRIIIDQDIYSSKSFYEALKDIEIDFFPRARVYKLTRLMDGSKLTQDKISKEFNISIDGVKGFFRKRQELARLIKLYNAVVNLALGDNKSSEGTLLDMSKESVTGISADLAKEYLDLDYRLRFGLYSQKLINLIRKDIITNNK